MESCASEKGIKFPLDDRGYERLILPFDMSINNLPQRLSTPAKLLFQAAKEAKVFAVMVGGAASIFHGCDRETKDLDIDVSDITAFADKIPKDLFDIRFDPKRSNRLSVTFKHKTEAVSVDISSEKINLWKYFKKYTVEDDSGVCFFVSFDSFGEQNEDLH